MAKLNPPKEKVGDSETQVGGQTLLFDLLVNAVRQAEMGFKLNETVSRLYSTVGKNLPKNRLVGAHGIENSDLAPYHNHRSYELLVAHGDESGRNANNARPTYAQGLRPPIITLPR